MRTHYRKQRAGTRHPGHAGPCHSLRGRSGIPTSRRSDQCIAFDIGTFNLRVLFRWDGDEAFLVNLGSHDQVY